MQIYDSITIKVNRDYYFLTKYYAIKAKCLIKQQKRPKNLTLRPLYILKFKYNYPPKSSNAMFSSGTPNLSSASITDLFIIGGPQK